MFSSGVYFKVGSYLPLATCFLIQDHYNLPKQGENGYPIEEESLCMHDSLTVGEGMRQKLWAILTGCMELLVLEKAVIRDEVLG